MSGRSTMSEMFGKTYIVKVLDDGECITEGELIRCRDCKHRPQKNAGGYTMPPRVQVGVYAWGEPEYDDDESCPYVCEDRWYSRIPNDEQYCDRAERKEHEAD